MKNSLFTAHNHISIRICYNVSLHQGAYQCLVISECWHLWWKVGLLIFISFLSSDCFYMPLSAHFLSCQDVRLSSMAFPLRNINFLICFTAAFRALPLLFSDPLGERLLLPKNSYYHVLLNPPRTHHRLPGVVLCQIINLEAWCFCSLAFSFWTP